MQFAPLGLARLALAALTISTPIAAQVAPTPIQDNSFLVEEAYNQGPGIVQHIGTFERPERGGTWAFGFTQEWPVLTQRHQLAYTIPFARSEGRSGIGDIALHYRYQAGRLTGARTAFAPRLSLIIPTGSAEQGMGAGGAGVQFNLPFSAELPRAFVVHTNAGATHTPGAKNVAGASAAATDYLLAQSVIWLVRPKFNIMLEAAWTSVAEVVADGRTKRTSGTLLSPGVRGALDFPSGLQVVPGLAFPISVGPGGGDWSVFAYVSFEHAFARSAP